MLCLALHSSEEDICRSVKPLHEDVSDRFGTSSIPSAGFELVGVDVEDADRGFAQILCNGRSFNSFLHVKNSKNCFP